MFLNKKKELIDNFMRLVFNNTKETPLNLMRRAGYSFHPSEPRSEKQSFVRRLSGDDYPRFHAYVKQEKNNLIINLHLDQKRSSYEGSVAHSGEYKDSDVLQKEIERIKSVIDN